MPTKLKLDPSRSSTSLWSLKKTKMKWQKKVCKLNIFIRYNIFREIEDTDPSINKNFLICINISIILNFLKYVSGEDSHEATHHQMEEKKQKIVKDNLHNLYFRYIKFFLISLPSHAAVRSKKVTISSPYKKIFFT